jgi:CRISPR-associated protein Cmr6
LEQPTTRGADGHAGLWFDKFCDKWRVEGRSWSMSADDSGHNPKLAWLRTVASGAPVGSRDQVEESALRLARLVHRRGGRLAVFETESRFVTGLGRSHPVENGFAWHATLGTPYLPGSSVKGLVRSWAREQDASAPNSDAVARLLGAIGSVGSVCFLDAVPAAPVRLEADVMTPHCAGWNEEDAPGDWCSPNPIPFLVTATGTPFLFGVVPCRDLGKQDLDLVMRWLGNALEWTGGGAKTAVGYGRFRCNDQQTQQWTQRLADEKRPRVEEQAQQEAMGSPEGRWRLEIQGHSEGEVLDLVRIHLEKEPLRDLAERNAFINAVVSTGLVEFWRTGNTKFKETQLGKKKLKQRARLLDTS